MFAVISKISPASPTICKEAILKNVLFKDLPLADPSLGGSLDVIIGISDHDDCLLDGSVTTREPRIIANNTIFGWTISGPLNGTDNSTTPILLTQAEEESLDQTLSRLWQMDIVPDSTTLSTKDDKVVDHSHSTYSVANDGRYMVRLPTVPEPPQLGNSRARAVKRFNSNKSSLRRKGKLEDFNAVLREYVDLDHAEPVPPHEISIRPSYYLPVHGVFKEASTSTKVRAVFDASAKTSSGHSLNDRLEAGPNLCPVLPDILIKFRTHQIGFAADISKMFREILLHPEERNLHRFLMRHDDGRLVDMRMKRLTFGIKSSPYLATQVLRHLADTHTLSHPTASHAILHDFYVDDYVAGADSIQQADLIRTELCQLLQLAGMKLRKWRTSSSQFREKIPEELRESEDLYLSTCTNSPKALGIHWDVANDCLHVATPTPNIPDKLTKRVIASDTARVFDILGLFSPALIPARILLQDLWKLPLKWDDVVPADVRLKWEQWVDSIPAIRSHAVSRRYWLHDSPLTAVSLHGFADASSYAYGAVIYLRQLHKDTFVSISIVTSKARVLPLKEISTPRAELLAAMLLAKLMRQVSRLLKVPDHSIFAWTDSMVVLHWLRKSPSSLKQFVANRVAIIQDMLPAHHWKHVPTNTNPADLLSRGMLAKKLIVTNLWWEGPPWLKLTPAQWPCKPFTPPSDKMPPESKVTCYAVAIRAPESDIWNTYSSFFRLVRMVAWALRFAFNASHSSDRIIDSVLTHTEIAAAKNKLLQLSQQFSFGDIIDLTKSDKRPPRGHPFKRLELSMDKGLLMVGTRVRDPSRALLTRSLIPLSLSSSITRLLISTLHVSYGHPGISALMSLIGHRYHIPGLHNKLKKISRACAVCQRAYAQPVSQQMGLLPLARTTPSPPFTVTGVDFAGPFSLRMRHTRKPVVVKGYACVFVCLSTRAVHLELCTELSSEEFLATFRRFIARRGVPAKIYSDNGTNFVGAHHEILEIKKFVESEKTRGVISHLCTTHDIQWLHIPPRAPHFGGLWEAAVKAMKILMRKIVGPRLLRFDELYTLLTEIEAVLNSRPLTSIQSTDPDDHHLTPGHFLVGRPLKSPPCHDCSEAKLPSLRRWTLMNRLAQDLWREWMGSFLQSLYHRSKWAKSQRNIAEGDIVFIKDEVLRFRDWPVARVHKTYLGPDGKVRAADLVCRGKIFNRSIHRLILVGQDDDDTSASRENVRESPGPITQSTPRLPAPGEDVRVYNPPVTTTRLAEEATAADKFTPLASQGELLPPLASLPKSTTDTG